MANELNIKNGLISKGQVQLEGGLISTGSDNINIFNPVSFSGGVTVTNTLSVETIDVSTRVGISGDGSSSLDASLFGSESGRGFVIPVNVPVDPTIGSMYVDFDTTKLNIWDGSTWRFVILT
jgi:hypothetical protein